MNYKFDFKYIVDPSLLTDMRIAVDALITKLDFEIQTENRDEDSYPYKYKKELEQLLINMDGLKTIYKPD